MGKEQSLQEYLDNADEEVVNAIGKSSLEKGEHNRGSNEIYNLLVPPEDQKIVFSPDQAEELTEEEIDVVVHMGCHAIRTPHIIDSTLDILEKLGYSSVPLGGFNNCCGILDIRKGNLSAAERVDDNRFNNIKAFDPDYALTECTSCYATTEKFSLGYRSPDFEVESMLEFLADRTDELVDKTTEEEQVTIAIHDHYDSNGWTTLDQAAYAREIFSALPDVNVVEIEHSMEDSIPCNFLADVSNYEFDDLSEQIFKEAEAAGADILINFWHACHRHLVTYEPEFTVKTKNYTTFIAERLGYSYADKNKIYKKEGVKGNVDKIIEDARPVFQANGLSEDDARMTIEKHFSP